MSAPGPVHDRIAFVHIPKTAGRSIAHAFEHVLGAGQCHIFAPVLDDAAFARHRFASAHTQLSQVTPTATAFTFLREPIKQLASHLRWLDRYNEPRFCEEVRPFSPSLRAAIRRIGRTDFAAPRALAALFADLPDDTHARLRNVQCEVLAARADRAAYTDPPSMALAAIAALPRLHFVGLVEHLATDLPALFASLHLPAPPPPIHTNTLSSPRQFDLSNLAIRRILARQVHADLRLYWHVLCRRHPSLRDRLRTAADRLLS